MASARFERGTESSSSESSSVSSAIRALGAPLLPAGAGLDGKGATASVAIGGSFRIHEAATAGAVPAGGSDTAGIVGADGEKGAEGAEGAADAAGAAGATGAAVDGEGGGEVRPPPPQEA